MKVFQSALLVTLCLCYCIQAKSIHQDSKEKCSKEDESGELENAPVPPHCGRSTYHSEHEGAYDKDDEDEEILSIAKRIVGGEVSRTGEWPWLVTIQVNFTRDGSFQHFCGGSLINNQWVLSASHCFFYARKISDASDWRVVIGEHNLEEDETHQIEYDVEKIIGHKIRPYVSEDYDNFDIALVKLARPVSFTDQVSPICLPSPFESFPPGTKCLVAGWGDTEEGGQLSHTVKHVEVPLVDSFSCSEMYEHAYYSVSILDHMICAGFAEGGSDSCQGDSGGPLICFDRSDKRWLLTGIVSQGQGCARPGFPGIYTDVVDFIPWIEQTIADDGETSEEEDTSYFYESYDYDGDDDDDDEDEGSYYDEDASGDASGDDETGAEGYDTEENEEDNQNESENEETENENNGDEEEEWEPEASENVDEEETGPGEEEVNEEEGETEGDENEEEGETEGDENEEEGETEGDENEEGEQEEAEPSEETENENNGDEEEEWKPEASEEQNEEEEEPEAENVDENEEEIDAEAAHSENPDHYFNLRQAMFKRMNGKVKHQKLIIKKVLSRNLRNHV